MMYLAIEGNLTRDPEVKYLNDGKAICNFTLADTASKKNRDTGEWEDEGTAFIRVTVFDKAAENAAATLKKGMHAFAYGRFKNRNWESNEGEKMDSYEMTADIVGPSLKRQTATVEKVTNNAGGGSSAWNNAPAANPAYGF